MKINTILAQVGLCTDEKTGSISTPIYQTATFRHPVLGQSTGYDYSRTANPTRQALEEAMTKLEKGQAGFAFSSGMAALTAIMLMFSSGDHFVVSDDLYGGTYRLLEKNFKQFGLNATYVDTSDLQAVIKAFLPGRTKAVLIETPTNPLMKVADIEAISCWAQEKQILTIVDNTFLTPYLQRPLDLGADLVVHSATKYLGGHNDALGGIIVARTKELAERVAFIQNSTGGVLGPQDSWLIIRGLKTLAVRLERQQSNARQIVQWLNRQPNIKQVYYPGIGGMLSFRVQSSEQAENIINRVKIVSFAESLGGVESLITYPTKQTHGDIPQEIRERVGVTDDLLRLSVGIEDIDDLVADLKQAIK